MKKIAVIILMAMLLINFASAQDENFNLGAGTIIRSKYVGPEGLQFYPNPVLQTEITLKHKSGLFLNVWNSVGFDLKWSADWDDEVDYTIGWSGKIKKIETVVSTSYFDNFHVGTFPYRDVIKGNVWIGMPQKINEQFQVTPFINYVTFIIPDEDTPFNGGNLYIVGVDGNIKITPKVMFKPGVHLLYDDGAFGVKPGALFKYLTTINWQISKHFVWNVAEIKAYLPLGKRNMKTETVLGTGLSWKL